MQLRKKIGGAVIAGIAWVKDGDIAEVPEELARELLAIAPHEFTHVPDEPKPAKAAAKPAAAKPASD